MKSHDALKLFARELEARGALVVWPSREDLLWRLPGAPFHLALVRHMHQTGDIARVSINVAPVHVSSRQRRALGLPSAPRGPLGTTLLEPAYASCGKTSCGGDELNLVIPWLARWSVARDRGEAAPAPPVEMAAGAPEWSYQWTARAARAFEARRSAA